jgi:hypothetical protein
VKERALSLAFDLIFAPGFCKRTVLCSICGAAHDDKIAERCHACGSSLGDGERLDHIYRIDNVEEAK